MQSAAERQRRYRQRHPDRVKSRIADYQASERGQKMLEEYKASGGRAEALARYNNSDKARAAKAKYRKTEKNRISQRKFDATPQGRLRRSLRDRVRKALKRENASRSGSAVRDLGCSIELFKTFIEGQFAFGMSWDNYGYWHLDHVKPLALFDLSDRAQFLEAMNYTNYQPLWAAENQRKAARYG